MHYNLQVLCLMSLCSSKIHREMTSDYTKEDKLFGDMCAFDEIVDVPHTINKFAPFNDSHSFRFGRWGFDSSLGTKQTAFIESYVSLCLRPIEFIIHFAVSA